RRRRARATAPSAQRVTIHLLLVHSLGARTGFGGAAEGRVVTAGLATVLEFSEVAFAMADDGQRGIATLTRVGANQLGGLALCIEKLGARRALLYAGDPHGLALGAHHRDAVVGFECV